MNKPKIFISHSNRDVAYVKMIVELFKFMGLDNKSVFCSSIEGYGVPLGKNIYGYLREQLSLANLHVIFVLSKNFYNSAICLNEMGAAWLAKTKYTLILLPTFKFEDISGVVDQDNIPIKLDDGDATYKLNELYEMICEDFGLEKNNTGRWESKRHELLTKLLNISPEYVSAISDKSPISVSSEIVELLQKVANSKNGQIVKKHTTDGIILFKIDNKKLNNPNNFKETIKINNIVNEAIKHSYFEQVEGYVNHFKITKTGMYLLSNYILMV